MVDWDNTQGYKHDLLCRCRQAAVAGGYKWFAADKDGLCLSKLGDLGSYLREFPFQDQAQCSKEMTQAPVAVPDGSRCIDGRFQPSFYRILTSLPPAPGGSSPGEAPPEEKIEEEIVSAPKQKQKEEVISSCKIVADIYVVIDTSGSIKQAGVIQTRKFLKSFMDRLDFADGTRIGIVTYNDKCTSILTWEESAKMNRAQLKEFCDTISTDGGSTRTDLGLECAYTDMKKSKRDKIPMSVAVMTDGTTWGGKTMLTDIAKEIRGIKAKILCVGIGVSVDREEMLEMCVKDDNILLLSDYSEVAGPQFLNNLIGKSCG